MEEYERKLKAFFEDEVSGKAIPPLEMPEKRNKKTFGWDNLLLAACTLGSLVIIVQPAIYENRIRETYVHLNHYESFKETVPRVIFEGFQYLKNKGVEND